MDWTPSQHTFQPNSSFSRLEQLRPVIESSPFQGHLPPAPKPPSWQLRNPVRQPTVGRAEDRPNPFHHAPTLHPKINNHQGSWAAVNTENVMAPPRFFPPSDFVADTGLEGLFNKTFSIADEPAEVQKSRWSSTSRQDSRYSSTISGGTRSSHFLKFGLLLAALVVWGGVQFFSLPGNGVEIAVLGVSFLIAGFSLVEALMKPLLVWNVPDAFLSLAELVACVYLATHLTRESYDRDFVGKVGRCLMAFMMGQEIIALRLPPAEPAVKPTPTVQVVQKARSPKALEYEPFNRGVSNSNEFSSDNSADNKFNEHTNNNPGMASPTRFSAVPRPPHSSFSASTFDSMRPENALSPTSTASFSSASYASSPTSEAPSPLQSSHFRAVRRRVTNPAISGLSLEDSPVRRPNPYPLRGHRA
jgi:hypothetical protein